MFGIIRNAGEEWKKEVTALEEELDHETKLIGQQRIESAHTSSKKIVQAARTFEQSIYNEIESASPGGCERRALDFDTEQNADVSIASDVEEDVMSESR